MSPWEGIAQLGEAAIGASSQKYARKLAEAEQERVRAANDKLVGQLGGYKDAPRRIEDRAPMPGFGQPTGAPIDLPEDMRVPTDKAEKLAAAIAGMDPGTANAALSGVALQQSLATPKYERVDLGDSIGVIDESGNVVQRIPKAATPDARLREQGATMRHETPSGSAQLGANVSMRGQDIGASTARRGQDVSMRGQDLTYDAALRGHSATAGRYEAEQTKIAEKEQARRESRAIKAQGVIDEVDKALGIVSPRTAGLMGAATRNLAPFEGAGTDARTLAATVETVQANLGFDELAEMRQNSPTGGALGQVAVQELVALRATIANLDPNLPPDVLKQNLEKVKLHYGRWLMTTQGQMPPPLEAAGGQNPSVGQFGMPPSDEALIGQFLNQGQ
jgi:hypothetical protein